jgi:hypothetical protein
MTSLLNDLPEDLKREVARKVTVEKMNNVLEELKQETEYLKRSLDGANGVHPSLKLSYLIQTNNGLMGWCYHTGERGIVQYAMSDKDIAYIWCFSDTKRDRMRILEYMKLVTRLFLLTHQYSSTKHGVNDLKNLQKIVPLMEEIAKIKMTID